MGCKVSSYRVGGGMTSSTISVNFNDTAQKTVFTATERCILKLAIPYVGGNMTFKLNSTDIGYYMKNENGFNSMNLSLANILSPMNKSGYFPNVLILYLEEGDTVYATRTSSDAFTATFYSAVFTF